jgi:hypothetical protein
MRKEKTPHNSKGCPKSAIQIEELVRLAQFGSRPKKYPIIWRRAQVSSLFSPDAGQSRRQKMLDSEKLIHRTNQEDWNRYGSRNENFKTYAGMNEKTNPAITNGLIWR